MTARRPSSPASPPSAACRWSSSPPARATTSRWTLGSTATTSWARSTPTAPLAGASSTLRLNGRSRQHVSLWLYAESSSRPQYRDTSARSPGRTAEMLGPGSGRSTWARDPRRHAHDGAHVIQVSNGPYARRRGVASRPAPGHGSSGSLRWSCRRAERLAPRRRPRHRAPGALYDGYRTWRADLRGHVGGPIAVGLDARHCGWTRRCVLVSARGLAPAPSARAIGYPPPLAHSACATSRGLRVVRAAAARRREPCGTRMRRGRSRDQVEALSTRACRRASCGRPGRPGRSCAGPPRRPRPRRTVSVPASAPPVLLIVG